MQIIVNARFLTQKVTGTQRFAINISRELKKLRPDTIFLAPPAILNRDLAAELDVKIIGSLNYRIYQKLHLPANLLWEQINLPKWLKKRGNPPLLSLVNLAPIFYANNFITIHDLAFRLYPQYFSRRFAFLYNLTVPRLARSAQRIFTVSQYSKKTLVQQLKIPAEKITVSYNAVDTDCWTSLHSQPSPYSWPYILAVGALEPRKNLTRLIAAFQKLNNDNLRLVIVGSANKEVFKKKNISSPDNKISPTNQQHVVFTGHLTDPQLNALYSHAVCFCYPSLFEGFGLPPLEAQAQGCPVIVSNRTSLPEVFAASALYCNPENINDIKEQLETILKDNKLRQSLITAGYENLKRFSWKKSARIIADTIIERQITSA